MLALSCCCSIGVWLGASAWQLLQFLLAILILQLLGQLCQGLATSSSRLLKLNQLLAMIEIAEKEHYELLSRQVEMALNGD